MIEAVHCIASTTSIQTFFFKKKIEVQKQSIASLRPHLDAGQWKELALFDFIPPHKGIFLLKHCQAKHPLSLLGLSLLPLSSLLPFNI